MKIAIVADKKAGHLSQCLGLRDILKKQSHDKDVFFLKQNLISLPGFLERALLLFGEKLYFFILKLLNPSLVEFNFNLVICSGSRTAIPAYLLARSANAKIIYIGTPKFRIMKKFDGIISTKSDLSKVFKVITTTLPPTKFSPYTKESSDNLNSLVLIGGDGSGYDYGEGDWYRLAYEFKSVNTTFINSRRTPKFAWENLKENKGPYQQFMDLENTPFEKLKNAIDSHANIFVTADSTSMIVEIITRGYFVNVIELRGPIKREHHHDMIENLQAKGLLRIINLTELHKSEQKLHGNVKEFVLQQREDLKQQILALL
jgi:mitochondrial fission protein ELM1